ncbi:MAG: hypothetical protein AB7U92_25100 [Piscinibacter sp.]|uniref:hypothetical protein n=1 Tax=Piscinibacter sp. TaxID=1903157 RepID=UPI003D10DDCC
MIFVFEEHKLREAFEAYCAAQGIGADRRDLEFNRVMAFLRSEQARAAKLWMETPTEVRT